MFHSRRAARRLFYAVFAKKSPAGRETENL